MPVAVLRQELTRSSEPAEHELPTVWEERCSTFPCFCSPSWYIHNKCLWLSEKIHPWGSLSFNRHHCFCRGFVDLHFLEKNNIHFITIYARVILAPWWWEPSGGKTREGKDYWHVYWVGPHHGSFSVIKRCLCKYWKFPPVFNHTDHNCELWTCRLCNIFFTESRF